MLPFFLARCMLVLNEKTILTNEVDTELQDLNRVFDAFISNAD